MSRRHLLGALLAVAVTAGIAALSRVPFEAEDDGAVLRLSWRTRSERVQSCRRLSPEELAELPEHMRRTEVCEGRVLPYTLTVAVDGRTLVDDTVRGGGARGDRPIFVLRELPLAPGEHDVRVSFVRQGEAGSSAHAQATPARMEIRRRERLRAGEVLLVTYDPDLRALVTRTPPSH